MAVLVSTLPFTKFNGRIGNIVFYAGPGGTIRARARVTPRDPRTILQIHAREALPVASRFWAELGDEERAAWGRYGDSLGRQGYRVFSGLAAKYRRLHADATPPSLPPTEAFFGDNVGLSASVPPDVRGVVRFEARRPDQEGVVVEILTQRMVARHRTPKARDWKTHGFVQFEEGDLTTDLELRPGAYAVAYKYVSVADGRETAMAELGRVTVA